MTFISSVKPLKFYKDKPIYIFVFFGNKILVKSLKNSLEITEETDFLRTDFKKIFLGNLNNSLCYVADYSNDIPISESLSFKNLKSIYGIIDDVFYKVAGFAFQILNWNKDNQFCSRCGSIMADDENKRAKICRKCGKIVYPKILPAIIVAITKGDRILLARSNRFGNKKMFSVLAGYLEIGETLEECVRREVKEEVGIKIKNIKYFDNQPWFHSNSIMIAFTADYAEGKIQPDGKEIIEAGWFKPDELPETPGWGSMAESLINWFCDKNKQ